MSPLPSAATPTPEGSGSPEQAAPTKPVAVPKLTASTVPEKPAPAKRSRVKISVLVTPIMDLSLRYVAIQREMRGDAVCKVQDMLHQAVRDILNAAVKDKTLPATPLLPGANKT